MINVPIFAAASPASFREAILAAKPDPKTGKPDPEKLKAYAATHPDAMALRELASRHTPTANYYQTTYSAFTRSSSSMRKAPSIWCGGASSRAMA
jgi:catalase